MRGWLRGAIGGLLVAAVSQSSSASLEVGQPAPDLLLPALDGGRPVSLADFRGVRLVLHVFASW